MARVDVEIPAPDGVAKGSLHVPDGDGPWPGVLVFPDAGGLRETFREMGDRIAGLGYVALIPDIYYREGDWAPFDMATAFSDEKERARLFGIMGRLTNERIIADSDAYADFLLARPEVSGSAIGTTGYCLGGRMSMLAAGGIGDKIAAAASFHGGRIAVADDPTSPHLAADRIAATVYVAGAIEDASFTTEQAALLESALTAPEWTTRSSSTRPITGSSSPTTTPTTRRRPSATGRPCATSTPPTCSRRFGAGHRRTILIVTTDNTLDDKGVSVGISGRIAPPPAHADALQRENAALNAHNLDSRPQADSSATSAGRARGRDSGVDGSGVGGSGAGDAEVPGAAGQVEGRDDEEEGGPSPGAVGEADDARAVATQPPTMRAAPGEAEVAVLPRVDKTLQAGSWWIPPPRAEPARGGVVVGCVHWGSPPVGAGHVNQCDITMIDGLSIAAGGGPEGWNQGPFDEGS